jgi:predicted RNA binding protein YcfA (HicA-like mRNA interferase family)
VSKKDKLFAKLHKVPPPKDFSWDDLVTLMRREGFSESCVGGSHYIFEHRNGFRFSMSKTHPAGILRRYQIDDAKSAIDAVKSANEGAT